MGLIIDYTDFVGKWDLAKSNNDLIDEYIELYEESFLRALLGKELFDLFKADLDVNGVPQTQAYKNIFNAFDEIINSRTVSSDGMKHMILGLIYFEYVRDNRVKQTLNGAVEQETEVSTKSDSTFLYVRYNKAIHSYNAIQTFILDNEIIYPTFKGICKRKTSFI